MTSMNKTAIVCIGLAFASTSAFAQAGGADVPTDAKKAGTMQNGSGSTGMSKSGAGGSMKSDSATSGGKSTATGGNAGGPAGKN